MYGGAMSPERLDRDAWVTAGLDALEQRGIEAVAVAALAGSLGVTRGSFYWHFSSRDELLSGVLEHWERVHSDEVLDALETVTDPRARLRVLLERAVSKPPSIFVRLLDAADREPLVAAVLERSGQRRLDVLTRACREAGMTPAEARRRALLCYAAYIGLARLAGAEGGAVSPRERAAFARHLTATLVP